MPALVSFGSIVRANMGQSFSAMNTPSLTFDAHNVINASTAGRMLSVQRKNPLTGLIWESVGVPLCSALMRYTPRCPTIRSVMVRFDVIRTPDEAPSFTYSAMNRNCGLPSNMAIVCDLDSLAWPLRHSPERRHPYGRDHPE